MFRLALPDAWIVSGCLVQTVWNGLTGRAVDYGINDYDVFYFDPDTSWQAEDAVIAQCRTGSQASALRSRRATRRASICGIPETWPALSGAAVIDRGHRPLPDQEHPGRNPPRASTAYEVYAPNGFDDIAAMIVRPNPGANFSAANYAAKAARWKALWPELTVLPADAL